MVFSILLTVEMEGEANSKATINVMRGYEVTVLVVCIIIILAMIMCTLTWRFRYKIVLRHVRILYVHHPISHLSLP